MRENNIPTYGMSYNVNAKDTLRKIDTKNEILECWILPYII